jgi:FkbM family methyltransferase
MSDRVDVKSVVLKAAAKAEAMYDSSRPGFVHASRKPEKRQGWTELTFPSGLICTTNSTPIETELMYNEIFEGREYLRSGIKLGDHDTIIDVGANIGMFTMYLLTNLENPNVHAFEPVPDTFEALQQNMERYPRANVHLYNTGLGASADSSMAMTFFPNMTGNSTAHPEWKAAQREILSKAFTSEELLVTYTAEEITVPSTTLSSFIRKNALDRIDLLKIDAEGCEVDILNGIEADHWSLIQQLAMEVHDEAKLLSTVINIVTANGMKATVDDASRDPMGTVIMTAIRR